MPITRRQILGGLAVMAACGYSKAAIIKAAIGARIKTTKQEDEDAMWKEMFFMLTEDTWPSVVVLPAEINKIGRSYWLCSSKVEDITFLCDEYWFSSNSVAYGSSKLKTIRMPNITTYKYPGPTMNGGATALYIPKVKAFTDARYCFGTSANTLDIYITESACDEIKSFQNFPGCAINVATMQKIVFHGSDGTLKYDGTQWVFTAA